MNQNTFPRVRKRAPSPKATPPESRGPGQITWVPTASLKAYAANARLHDDKQIGMIALSIDKFGFNNPILIDQGDEIVAGHGRYEAAKRLGLDQVPVVRLEHLSEAQIRADRIADNRIAELSEWDEPTLRLEIADLVEMELAGELEFPLDAIGFETPEIDVLLGRTPAPATPTETVELPDPDERAVSRPGDLWCLGDHRLHCGDALEAGSYEILLGDEKVQLLFSDPPYNVPITGHVRTGKGHREFAMGVGEMSEEAFRAFLRRFTGLCRDRCMDGAVAMIFIDWRHVEDMIAAGRAEGLRLLNLCAWVKSNGAMGSLYRSKHELVPVFRIGTAPHVNNVELGRHGRNRTNVWEYAGVNTFRRGREADLADHPTVKPTALIMDAIKDVSHRGEIILDPFGGSGSTLLAAEKTARRARLIEIDPLYVDVAIRRWEALTGRAAVLSATGETFTERAVAVAREAEAARAIGEGNGNG